MNRLKKYCIVYGHYGSGKTTVALNFALRLARDGKKVTVVDLDIVNPYFRSSDYTDLLKEHGIQLIAPSFAGTTLDIPALPAEIYSVTSGDRDHVLFDIGGDDAGAAAFGGISEMIRKKEDYQAFFILNRYRKFISHPEAALQILKEIEMASRLKATHLINNSHLGEETSVEDVRAGFDYGDDFSAVSGLPLYCTTVPEKYYDRLAPVRGDLFKIKTVIKPPW